MRHHLFVYVVTSDGKLEVFSDWEGAKTTLNIEVENGDFLRIEIVEVPHLIGKVVSVGYHLHGVVVLQRYACRCMDDEERFCMDDVDEERFCMDDEGRFCFLIFGQQGRIHGQYQSRTGGQGRKCVFSHFSTRA